MIHIQKFVFSPIQENTYLLYNEKKECIIVDPGCYFEEERWQLLEFIQSHELKPTILLNTHCHLDHIFGNKFVFEQFGLLPHIHLSEKPVFDAAPASGLMYDMPFDHYQGDLQFIEEGHVIHLGDCQFRVLLTPGHSPGSVSFYCEKERFVIAGDVLFHRSIGRTDLPGGDFDTLIHSIKNQLLVLPDETRVYSGHGQETSIGEEKIFNPFLQ